jgi:hypothetical protein
MIFNLLVKKRVIVTRELVTVRVIRRIHGYQTKEGCIPHDDKTAEYFGFENTEQFTKHLQNYFKSERVTKVQHVWASACTIWYLRYVAVDHRQEWVGIHDKAFEYLKAQCNDSGLENEVLECAKKFIIERYQVDKESIEADRSFAEAIKNKEKAIEEEAAEKKRQELLGLYFFF